MNSERFPPCGWVCVRSSVDRVEYRPERWRFALTAVQTAEDAWEMRCRQGVGEADSSTCLGFVATRESAVRSLFDCMREVNRTMRESSVERVLDVRRLKRLLDRRRGVRPIPPDRSPDERRFDSGPKR